MKTAFLLTLLLIIFPCFAHKSPGFFSLILMWPGAYCQQTNVGCCLPTTGEPARDFLITDLVTYNSTGEPISKCQNINFDYNKISSLSHNLEVYWASIKCPSNNGRSNWKSKWRSHGVCSGLNQKDYFKTGLDLLQKADISSHLVNNGINPDYNLYDVADIKNAIAGGIGAEPLIRCSKGPFKKFQLFEVHICVAGDGKTIIKCPINPKFTCSDEILFHPYRGWMLRNTTRAFGITSNIQLPIQMEIDLEVQREREKREFF